MERKVHTYVKDLGPWLKRQIQSFPLQRDLSVVGGTPSDLNEKQFDAFSIVSEFLLEADRIGVENAPQLLLNIGGPAGSGKTFWLNTMRRWAKDHIKNYGQEFITTAAPTGSAAFLIGGSTLHSLLFLNSKLKKNQKLPRLGASQLKDLQDRFKNVGVLVIDEKSMIGHKTMFMISERLKEARPKHQDKPFGGVSVILLGDIKQLPPVLDSALHTDKIGKWRAGHNLYRHFEDTIKFTKVERQLGDAQKEFRDELERLSNGEFTKADYDKWKKRCLNKLSPEERRNFETIATKACSLTKDMESFNIKRIQNIGNPIASLPAVNDPDCPENRGRKAERESNSDSMDT